MIITIGLQDGHWTLKKICNSNNIALTNTKGILQLYLENFKVLIFTDFTIELRGVDVCGEMSFKITKHASAFEWDKFGLSIQTQEGSLPTDVEQVTVYIKVSVSGDYEFTKNSHLVSAIFWFYCDQNCKFLKPVVLKVQHCAKTETSSNLVFVKTNCTQAKLPYTFKTLLGGSFNENHGQIELKSFSGVGVVQNTELPLRRYRALNLLLLSSLTTKSVVIDLYFVVIWDDKSHYTVSYS